ncbi:MAG: NTP transferase domain-containing protein, partial [Acidimicrobiia bacterium]|nr:NTP transferase domain-containing protein [Acidimicrobiia bacterium]
RMRPATRSVPKALLPIVDRPAVQYVVEEAIGAGVDEIVIVADPDGVDLIDRHFHGDGPLPGLQDVTIHVIAQPRPSGLGDAIARTAPLVGDRPFYCLLVDVVMPPGASALTDLGVAAGPAGNSLAVRRVPMHLVPSVGVVEIRGRAGERIHDLAGAVEKPHPDEAPSDLGIVGRYLFQPEIFPLLDEVEPGHNGEVQLTDAIDTLARTSVCRSVTIGFDVLDVGTPRGYAEAWASLASAHPDWGRDYSARMRPLAAEELALIDLAQSVGLPS